MKAKEFTSGSSLTKHITGGRGQGRGVSRGFAAALLFLLLAGLAPWAVAQTSVPPDWPLKPSGLGVGDQFRLLFVTSTTRDATSTDIADYNNHVQSAAAAGHTAIREFSSQFRAVGSTATVDARDNTMTTGTGVPIYWLNGVKVADNYADFYDGTWDSRNDAHRRSESGAGTAINTPIWTGSFDDGTKRTGGFNLGGASFASISTSTGITSPFNSGLRSTSATLPFYALSPVFEVGTVTVGPSVSVSDGTVAESASPTLMRFTVTLSEPLERRVRVRVQTHESDPVSAGMHHDFRPLHRVLTFRPGETENHVWVTVHRDNRVEGPETFRMVLSRADGVALGKAVGVGTITEGPIPAVTVSRSSLSLDEGGGAARYSVAVSAGPAPGETVTVAATRRSRCTRTARLRASSR